MSEYLVIGQLIYWLGVIVMFVVVATYFLTDNQDMADALARKSRQMPTGYMTIVLAIIAGLVWPFIIVPVVLTYIMMKIKKRFGK